MINNIKTVSSFAHRDKLHILSNVLIKDGIMTCQDDMRGISVKVDSDLDFCCNAERLRQSLNNCDPAKIKMSIKKNKIYITSGRFRTNIELIPVENYPVIENNNEKLKVQSDILKQLDIASKFTDINDVRLFCKGVNMSDGLLTATNGRMAIEKEISDIDINPVIIPTKAIESMAKLNTFIDSLSVDSGTIFFNFEDGFLFTRTIDQKMPDLSKMWGEVKNITELSEIKDAVKTIAPFCEFDRTMVFGESIRTRNEDSSVDGFNFKDLAFNVDYILKIIEVADQIDLTIEFPKMTPFKGEGVRGVVAGVKL